MRLNKQMGRMGLLLFTVLALGAPAGVCAKRAKPKNTVEAPHEAKVFELHPGTVTAMVGKFGELSSEEMIRVANPVRGFHSPEDSVTWTVIAPKDDEYVVSILFSMKDSVPIEVRAGDSVLTAMSDPYTWKDRPYFWRQELKGTLHLKEGENKITFRLPEAKPVSGGDANANHRSRKFGQAVQTDFHLFSIELGTAADRKGMLERAQATRGDTSWMVDGKYGLFVHWSANSYPLEGDERRAAWFQKSVEMFDVQVFADAVERTGAAWIVFTATHQGFFWPGPNAAVDKVLPGRTAKRDLLGEIIDELDTRGIRTLFYLHTGYNGYGDPAVWRDALGVNDWGTTRFSDNVAAIFRDCSLRYGEKLKGFGYIDGSQSWDYPFNPSWEDWAGAIRAGNPKAVVGFSSNRGTTVSPFTDLAVTDSASELDDHDAELIGPGCQLGDVTDAWWCLMDKEGWMTRSPMNGSHGAGPVHSTQEYVDFFVRMAEAKVPVTINVIMTADVTDEHPLFNPKCMDVMEKIRKAVRGE